MNEAAAPADSITVLFATDLNYLQHAMACIASLLANNPRTNFDVLLVGVEDFSAVLPRIRRSFEAEQRLRLRIEKFALPPDFRYPRHPRFPAEAYIRFWIGELLSDAYRALYLDPDIIVTADIGELWNWNLEGHTLAAVPIPGSTCPAVLGLPPDCQYFNSGVMLIELDAWRTHRYRERCVDYLQEHPEKAIDPDQDILNAGCGCRAGRLSSPRMQPSNRQIPGGATVATIPTSGGRVEVRRTIRDDIKNIDPNNEKACHQASAGSKGCASRANARNDPLLPP
jgi:lipopolysaccharide biosynthesis glycosyltransferase